VLVGGQALKALNGDAGGIFQQRGQWLDCVISPTLALPALSMLPPAHLLRNPLHKRLAWADLLLLKQAIDRLPPR
jgi:uracil-DNA glycosylase